ncbi:MAG: hypothetical protein OXG08_03275 [Gammaproteobacteria bacterium]|nr:hypothetical protein [Gammaproteobacteria bacterium]
MISRHLLLDIRFLTGILSGALLCIVLCIGIEELTSDLGEGTRSSVENAASVSDSSAATDPSQEEQLQAIVEIQSPTERRIAVRSLLFDLDAKQLAILISTSASLEASSKLRAVQALMFEELAGIDPERALRQVSRMPLHGQQELLTVVFREWSRSNMRSALRRAHAMESPYADVAVQAVISERADLSDSDLMKIARDHNVERIASHLILESQVMRSMGRPTRAIDMVASSDLDEGQQLALLKRLFRTWIQRNGIDGILPLFPDIHSTFRAKTTILEGLFADIARHNPQAVWEGVLSGSVELQQRAAPAVLAAWAESDPHEVLQAVSGLNDGYLRGLSYSRLIEAWSRVHPADLLENARLFPQAYRESAIVTAIARLARTGSIDEARRHLQDIKSRGESVDRPSVELVRAWAIRDPAAATAWTLEFAPEESSLRGSLLGNALPKLALVDPDEAMQIALAHPYDESSSFVKPDMWVVQGLASSGRLDIARTLLDEVREPMRLGSFASMGMAFIEFGQPDEAVTLAQELSEADQEHYFARITALWLSLSPDHLIDNLESLPSEGVRKAVAKATLDMQRYVSHLSTEQTEYARTFLDAAGAE